MKFPRLSYGQKFFYVSAAVVLLSGVLTMAILIVAALVWRGSDVISVTRMDHAVHSIAPEVAESWDEPERWEALLSGARSTRNLEPMRISVVDTEGNILFKGSDVFQSLSGYDGAKIGRDEVIAFLAGKGFVDEDRAYVVAPITRSGRPVGVLIGDLANYSAYQRTAPINPLTMLLVPLFVTVAVSLLASRYLGRGLRRRLSTLTAAILAMAKGNYRSRLEVEAQDEIGQVAASFNSMADRLQEARDQEQALDQLKRDLITNVSHDLRGPLTSLRGYVEALQAGLARDPATAERYTGIIERKTEQLTGLVEDLLLYSRLESGHLPLQREVIPVAEWLRASLAMVEPDIDRAAMELTAEIPDSTAEVHIDERKVNQVIDNLVRNALRYAPAGSTLVASLRLTEAEAVITLADAGPGIDPADLPQLFQRFYQGRHKHEGVGTGLGLAIAAEIVKAHGGRIWAENLSPKGAAFHFTLPLHL